MDDEQGTPEDELEQPAAGTPPETPDEGADGEPAAEEPAEDRPDQSPARNVIAQAEYTRATQTAAAIRKELGLDKSAPQAEVIAALQALRTGATGDEAGDDEDDELSERERLAIQRATAAEIRVQAAVYGDQFANDGLELANLLRSSDDVEEMFTALASFVQAHGGPPAVDASDESETDEDAGEAGTGGVIDTSEGDAAPRSTESAPRTRRESGVVSALRGIFSEAQAATRPPPRK